MMNPNAYGPPPAMPPTQQMMPGVPGGQQSIPQQQYPGWSPQGPVQGSPAGPPSGSVPSNVPLSSIPQTGIATRNVLNGNYQQQVGIKGRNEFFRSNYFSITTLRIYL